MLPRPCTRVELRPEDKDELIEQRQVQQARQQQQEDPLGAPAASQKGRSAAQRIGLKK
jgi:hypothetical protein